VFERRLTVQRPSAFDIDWDNIQGNRGVTRPARSGFISNAGTASPVTGPSSFEDVPTTRSAAWISRPASSICPSVSLTQKPVSTPQVGRAPAGRVTSLPRAIPEAHGRFSGAVRAIALAVGRRIGRQFIRGDWGGTTAHRPTVLRAPARAVVSHAGTR